MTKSRKNNLPAVVAMTAEALATGELETLMADVSAGAAALESEAEVLAEAEAAAAPAAPETPATTEPEAAPADETVVIAHVPGDLKEMVKNVTPEAVATKQTEVNAEFSSRIAFEKAQPGLSAKMVPNLEASQKRLSSLAAAGLFCAVDLDPAFINREVAVGSRFNVYALQKVGDLVVGMTGGFLQNAINRAVLLSLFNFRDAGMPFNGDAALAAVSDKVKIERAIAKHLVRHTVSANTASTQKSSTMNALEVMGVVTSNKLKGKAEIFTLTDTPQTRRLEEVLRKAA